MRTSEAGESRPFRGEKGRAKIIQLPRIRPSMPGITENRAASRAPESRMEEIRAYVGELLGKPAFARSGRRGQLLQYLVQHTLAGDVGEINEYTIGLEVFDKPTSFDPRIESVVRTEFSRLRQKLKDYYGEEGRGDRIAIEFPPRSYAATFTFCEPAAGVEGTSAPQLVPAAPAKPRFSMWAPATALAAVVVVGTLAGYALWKRHALLVTTAEPIHAIVVLPFENYSSNHQDEYLADGMTEELTNDLAQWRDLRVVARTSAFAFKGRGEDVRKIGQVLNVDAVLEGSFTKEGDRIRITAQLNRTADGYHLWSHAYETQSNDLLALQEEIANAITAAIRTVRGGGRPPAIHMATGNPEAEDLYLQGMYQAYQVTPASTQKAADLFEEAIAKDPSFARAYYGAAMAEQNLVSTTAISAEEGIPKARAAAQKAVELDPTLSAAWGLLGATSYTWDWNWERAEEDFRHALELGAGPGIRENYGWGLATRGRFAEAHEQLRLAAQQDPLAATPAFNECFVYYFERNIDGQKAAVRAMLRVAPHFYGAHAMNQTIALEQKDCARTQQEAEWFRKALPALPVTQSSLFNAAVCRGNRGEALQLAGKMAAAKVPAYQLAIAWALLGERDKAIAELSRSADAHEGQILYLKYDMSFDGVRADPRYVALEKRVGLIQ